MKKDKIDFSDSICNSIKKSKSFNKVRLKAIARKAIFEGGDFQTVLSFLNRDFWVQDFTSIYGSDRAKDLIDEIINEALVAELI